MLSNIDINKCYTKLLRLTKEGDIAWVRYPQKSPSTTFYEAQYKDLELRVYLGQTFPSSNIRLPRSLFVNGVPILASNSVKDLEDAIEAHIRGGEPALMMEEDEQNLLRFISEN